MWSKAESQGLGSFVRLLAVERQMLLFIAAIGLLAVGLALVLQRQVNWPPFVGGYLATLGIAAIGGYVRQTKSAPRLGLALVGAAIFTGFTAVSSVFIYALLPLPNPMVDDHLTRIGHLMGYDWQRLVMAMTAYPRVTSVLGTIYQSALPQLGFTLCLLAALGRPLELHRFLLVGMLTLIICVAVWWAWPSVGYVGTLPLSDAEMRAAGLIYSQDYGAYLTRLLQDGPPIITPEVVTGVVGFPSYHTVMACMVVWYCRRTVLFLPALVVNIGMLFATLVQGGHHLVDLIGGLLVFAIGVWIGTRLIRAQD